MNKDLRKIVVALHEQGFSTKVTAKGHVMYGTDDRWLGTLPGTPSDRKSMDNALRPAVRAGFIKPSRG